MMLEPRITAFDILFDPDNIFEGMKVSSGTEPAKCVL